MNTSKHRRSSSFLRVNYYSLLSRLKEWIRCEISDDDPWDVDTLFPHDCSIQNCEQEAKLASQDAIVLDAKNRMSDWDQPSLSKALSIK